MVEKETKRVSEGLVGRKLGGKRRAAHEACLLTYCPWERPVECLQERKPNGLRVDWAWPRITVGLAIDQLTCLGFIYWLDWANDDGPKKITQMGVTLGSK